MPRSRRRLLSTVGLLAMLGCRPAESSFGEPSVHTTEQRPTRWDEPDARRLPAPSPASRSVPRTFTASTPAGFTALPAEPARLRDLRWRVGGVDQSAAECYLTASVGGTVEQNLARWYGQFGAAAGPLSALVRAPFAGGEGRLLELAGTYEGRPGQAMLVAFAELRGSLATLKLVGDEAIVQAHRAEFLGLAAALREAPPGTAGSDPHGGHGDGTSLRCTATAPPGWQPEPGSKRLLHHTFGERGEVYVGALPYPLRGLVDVWRGEFGLPAIGEAEFAGLAAIELLGLPGVQIDLGGATAGRRLRIAAAQQGGQTLFVRLSGPPGDVEPEEAAFAAFCRSLRRER